ncbi:MAG TPA: tetratricopeptide repeat protein [Myxococcota bacterium]|nr:tetratricopeptide repeat protein [Myxococcota bacterium]
MSTLSETQTPLFVARPSDVAVLRGALDKIGEGSGCTLALQAPVGGGKRALVGEFLRGLGDFDGIIWRIALVEEEEGLRSLLRFYATLYAALSRDVMTKGRAEMILNAQLPQKPKRVQQWYQAFIEGLKKGGKPGEDGGMQVTLPRDNPLLGIVEIVRGLADKTPVILDIQNVHSCQSVGVHAMLECLVDVSRTSQLLLVLGHADLTDENRAWMPAPFLDMLDRRSEDLDTLELSAWGADEAGSYLASKGLEGDAAGLANLAGGRPGYIAEIADILVERSELDKAGQLDLAGLYPREVDEDELESGEGAGGRRRATAADLDEIAFRAALLGRAFPATILADIGQFDRDSIDDLLDAASDLFTEMEFSKPLNTWLYQFKRAAYREGALVHGFTNIENAQQIALQSGTFIERFLMPRAYDFVVKTARLYAKAGQPKRAAVVKGMAVSGDRPEMWSFTHNLLVYYQDKTWPVPMERAVRMNLMDRMAAGGDVNQAETLFNETMKWADEQDDRRLKAWLLFAGSRLDVRRQDLYRGRDRAKDALTLYSGLGDKLKTAEVTNHLAVIEFRDGNTEAARQLVDKALQAGTIETQEGKKAVLPQIAAHAEYTRGLVAQKEKKLKEAVEHFRLANEISGNTGQAPLALESGLAFSQALLMSGDPAKAADSLQRVVQIAGSLGDGLRQRAAGSLLAQSHGALKNFDAALEWSKRTLQMTEKLKLQPYLAIDTFNVALFTLMKGRPTEALALFRKARAVANLQQNAGFAAELLFNMGMCAAQIGELDEARDALTQLLPLATQTRNAPRFVVASIQLARLTLDKGQQKVLLDKAAEVAEQAKLKEQAKEVKKAMKELGL